MRKNTKEILNSVLNAFPHSTSEGVEEKRQSRTEYLIHLIDQSLTIK